MNPTSLLVTLLLAQAKALLPTMGGARALDATERAATVPERDVRKMCAGMDEPKVDRAVGLWRRAADAISDAVVYTASRGSVEPD